MRIIFKKSLILAMCVYLVAQSSPGTIALQAPLSVEFSRQEYWSGLPFSSPGNLSNPGIKPRSPVLQAGSLPAEPPWKPLGDSGGNLERGLFREREVNNRGKSFRRTR